MYIVDCILSIVYCQLYIINGNPLVFFEAVEEEEEEELLNWVPKRNTNNISVFPLAILAVYN